MNTETSGIIAMFVITLLLALPLGRYMASVYNGERTLLDPVLTHWSGSFLNTAE